jgi:nucleoside-diphosphate-sugar epimerase
MQRVLRAAGHEVTGLDTCYFEECGNASAPADIPAIRKDIRDVVPSDVEGFDAIVHLAGLCNDPLGDLNPRWTFEINHAATIHLAQVAKGAAVRRFLFASSCSLYGKADDRPLAEDAPMQPLTPYAASKVRAETDLALMASDDFSPVFMRSATAYGMSPRFRADVVLNNLVCWACATGRIQIMSDGLAWRPIVHVEDISNAFAAALTASRSAIHNQAFNVGVNEENYRVRDLAEIVREVVPGCEVEYAGTGNHDRRSYRVNFDKLTQVLDFEPKWNAHRGAHELYESLAQGGITQASFEGRKFTRLAQLKYLLSTKRLDGTLRWKNQTVNEWLTESEPVARAEAKS